MFLLCFTMQVCWMDFFLFYFCLQLFLWIKYHYDFLNSCILLFFDIRNMIFWYQEKEVYRIYFRFFDKKNQYFDNINLHSLYQKILCIFWYQGIEISDIKKSLYFYDSRNSFFWYQKMICWYQWVVICWYQKMICWYQKMISIFRN